MANVFVRTNEATPQPNRNTFDLSFVNNMTLKAGVITPCFLKEVIPGDSVQIDATFGFNFQPMVFPVQTDMQANLHFFYVRNRALWRGWQDFITHQENIDGDSTPPFIKLTEENRDMFETGHIGDYLGVPTVYYSQGVVSEPFDFHKALGTRPYVYGGRNFFITPTELGADEASKNAITDVIAQFPSSSPALNVQNSSVVPAPADGNRVTPVLYGQLPSDTSNVRVAHSQVKSQLYGSTMSPAMDGTVELLYMAIYTDQKELVDVITFRLSDLARNTATDGFTVDGTTTTWQRRPSDYNKNLNFVALLNVGFSQSITFGSSAVRGVIGRDGRRGVDNSSRRLSELPFNSTANTDGLRISALPFRAVEACYNSFYRDDRNNPLMIDGKPYYNIWTQNKNGGADTNHYKLYKRNWEADVFTTAVQSPTQGVLPLVGVTATGNMTFQDENGKTYYLKAELADDGTLTGISSYSSDMPQGTVRAMVDTISTGISINDFRNVNAIQRWLEIGMRKGLRYKDNIEAHFGTAPTYSELDMPEFIGGMSRKVQMNRIVQSVDQPEQNRPLGTLGGYATVLGDGGQKISKYFDEHGWVIGFITITPKPVYSQQLSKQLIKTELLDHYFPEFAHISMQAITNKELAVLQCANTSTNDDGTGMDDVFGYQRAWYEYLSSIDEVHGDFRVSMRDYLIQRTFDGVPQLSEEFLTVGDKEVNEVFAVEDVNVDKIFGQLYFDVKMKRPIPAIGIPKLEA